MAEGKKQNLDKQLIIKISNEMLEELDWHAKDMGGLYRSHLIKMVLQEWITKRNQEKGRDQKR